MSDPLAPRPVVVLRHTLSDGSFHYDWMFARDSEGLQPLRTFRCASNPSVAPAGAVLAVQPLADHRPAYLTYEGPISGGRGTVQRIAHGAWSGALDECTLAWDTLPAPHLWCFTPSHARRLR